jgi:hypothetical protein
MLSHFLTHCCVISSPQGDLKLISVSEMGCTNRIGIMWQWMSVEGYMYPKSPTPCLFSPYFIGLQVYGRIDTKLTWSTI